MGYLKQINFFENTTLQSKCRKKDWVERKDNVRITNMNSLIVNMLNSRLCDFNNAYILVIVIYNDC